MQQAFDLFGGELPLPPAEMPPPGLTAKLERLAQSCRRCLPQLCQEASGGRTVVAMQLTRDEAKALIWKLTMDFKAEMKRRDGAARTE